MFIRTTEADRVSSKDSGPRTLTPTASPHLDLIRALAAWVVIWDHARSLLFVGYQQLRNPSRLTKALFFLTGSGHKAVMVFFVLSVFPISSAIISRWISGSWSWRDYAIARPGCMSCWCPDSYLVFLGPRRQLSFDLQGLLHARRGMEDLS